MQLSSGDGCCSWPNKLKTLVIAVFFFNHFDIVKTSSEKQRQMKMLKFKIKSSKILQRCCRHLSLQIRTTRLTGSSSVNGTGHHALFWKFFLFRPTSLLLVSQRRILCNQILNILDDSFSKKRPFLALLLLTAAWPTDWQVNMNAPPAFESFLIFGEKK